MKYPIGLTVTINLLTNKIIDSVKDVADAKETIANLLEIIDDMKNETPSEVTYYQGTSIGFVQS